MVKRSIRIDKPRKRCSTVYKWSAFENKIRFLYATNLDECKST